MISVDAYLLTVAGVLLTLAVVVIVLGHRQKVEDERDDAANTPAE